LLNQFEAGADKDTRRIAYVMKMFPRISETFIMNEILALEALGVRLLIISLQHPDLKVAHQQLNSIRAHVYYVPESFWRDLPHIFRAQAHFMFKFPSRWIRALTFMLRRRNLKAAKLWLQSARTARLLENSGLSHLHSHFALLTSTFLGLHFSFTCHAKDVYANNRLTFPDFFMNLDLASFVVCGSERTRHDILNAWPNLAPEKIHVVYNGLDLERFQRRTAEPGGKEGAILSVGRFVEKKGFPDLIRACALLRDRSVRFSCQIVGYGPMRKSLAELISALRLEKEVHLVGAVSQQELITYYESANVFCLPTTIASNDDRDIIPNVVKEAMAVGVPVATTSIPSMEEIVEDGKSGLLVPERQGELLAQSLELLIRDRELGKRVAQAGRQVIEERFDRSKNVQKLRKLFEPYLSD
jgi:glycosyltransferase involved in cell wall biosynthesis